MSKREVDFAQNVLNECGIAYSSVTKQERWTFLQRWREVYAAHFHAKTGKWCLGEFDWHIFANDEAVYMDGSKALELYSQISIASYYFLSDILSYGTYLCRNQRVPNLNDLIRQASQKGGMSEFYVMDVDLNWTFMRTHEEDWGCGPYFSRASWQTDFLPGKLSAAQLDKLTRQIHVRHDKT